MTHNATRSALLLLALIVAPSSLSTAQSRKPAAPLFDGLGSHQHPVTTGSKPAQRYFDQGLILCYAFNHSEAIRSFRAAIQADPECGMAYWGVAYASGPHVNRPMDKADNDRAWQALQQAVALKSNLNQRERAYIEALSRRYQAEFTEDRSGLDKAYAAAMRTLAREYPDDLDARTLFAEALLDTMPWDYWLKDRSPKPETEEAFAALRHVLKYNPDHPGAAHFYIHAVEAGPNPELGLPSADRLRDLVPQAGHLVHMPAHIYMRVGQYRDAELANVKAVKADRSYISQCAAQGFYPGAYYPHNEHFLWYATLFQGRSKDALKAASKTAEIALENYCGERKAVEGPRLRHLPWLTLARFGRWDEVLAIKQPPATNDFLIDRAIWHYTRGLAYCARNDLDHARLEQTAMLRLIESGDAAKLDNPAFPATAMLQVPKHLLAGRIAGVAGDTGRMLEELQKAVEAETTLPYMEPAYWPVPTRPTLGAAFLKAGKAAEAEQVFRDDLSVWPRNGWSLFGLEQSLRDQGRSESADMVRREFEAAWKRADTRLDLASY